MDSGNTPTCVGKTVQKITFSAHSRKHPHVRGEDMTSSPSRPLHAETPPRAWGRQQRAGEKRGQRRNTPTCVGKTSRGRSGGQVPEKHPHVRGEDPVGTIFHSTWQETPPRAWGRPVPGASRCQYPGNTPTCVGKTGFAERRETVERKHPHVRGEDPQKTHPLAPG